jgi:glycosyltransferase involved in cell wall biosynthesis
MPAAPIQVSVVVPFFNAGRDMVRTLHETLGAAVAKMPGAVELIYVDDGSSDDTMATLDAIQKREPAVVVIELAANFGQHAAFSAGFDHARGRYIVTMDADLQCDPEEIPLLLAPLEQGYDFVSGVRRARQDPTSRRLWSRALTRLVTSMTGVKLRDIGCPFNACTAEVARTVASFGELRRFLKPLALRVSKRVAEVEVSHRPRHHYRPRSSYSATGLVRLFMDFFVNTASDVFAWLFVVAAGLTGLAATITVLALVLALSQRASWSAVLFAAATTLLLTATTSLGLAGDYVQRIYRQSSGRPFYLVRTIHASHALGERA